MKSDGNSQEVLEFGEGLYNISVGKTVYSFSRKKFSSRLECKKDLRIGSSIINL
jgi:hypothetical protein